MLLSMRRSRPVFEGCAIGKAFRAADSLYADLDFIACGR
jgi:hypothetical protein